MVSLDHMNQMDHMDHANQIDQPRDDQANARIRKTLKNLCFSQPVLFNVKLKNNQYVDLHIFIWNCLGTFQRMERRRTGTMQMALEKDRIQCRGCTTEMYLRDNIGEIHKCIKDIILHLSTVTETVDQMDPLSEIWMMGRNQGNRWGCTQTWRYISISTKQVKQVGNRWNQGNRWGCTQTWIQFNFNETGEKQAGNRQTRWETGEIGGKQKEPGKYKPKIEHR